MKPSIARGKKQQLQPAQDQQTDVQAARGRLRGALNDSLQTQDVDDISEDYEEEEAPAPPPPPPPPPAVVSTKPQRGRPRKYPAAIAQPAKAVSVSPPVTPKKKRKLKDSKTPGNVMPSPSQSQKIQAESFVMKLFDRSLDLSKYAEQTALYPICRAWMANQPRNPSIRSYREARSPSPSERKDNGEEILAQLRRGEIREVTTLPKPRKTDLPKIPPQKQPQKYEATDDLFESTDPLRDADKETILSDHIGKWKGIKKEWQRHSKQYQKRNEVNFMILQELFN